eukprot:maker-scaffold590_size129399-snap-gene-0.33 protein:Tk08100 transcript:maker-scaffold590_size129399-snap-gene-0.33-mRNA-1 annotation:"tyrosine-protein kinase transmembrane receptor ror"
MGTKDPPTLAEPESIPLDVIGCGCVDPKNCACPRDGGGCRNGFCFCPLTGQLEYDERRCHPAYGKSEEIHSVCPIPCACGCRSSEICGADGRCYCPDGTLVVPLVNASDHLIGHNQTCPRLVPTTLQPPAFIAPTSSPSTSIPVILMAIAAFGSLVLVLTCTIVFFLRRKDQKQLKRQFNTPRRSHFATSGTIDSQIALEMTPNDLYESARLLSSETLNLLGSKAIQPERIQIKEQVGQGNFGTVYRGRLQSLNGGDPLEVAIKVPRLNGRDLNQMRDFYLEAQITMTLENENILSCIGISADQQGAPWLLFEFMPFGDLAESDLWWLSLQIARGMKYLSDRHFTHRDLAARNCLLGHNLALKISDFGLTRDIYTNEYYQVRIFLSSIELKITPQMGEHRLLPIRWMSPESIQFGKFSTETDIWSFGVVLWEIFSFGKRPYFSYSNQEVAELLPVAGISLRPPEACPDLLKSIMLSCLQTEVKERISFEEIIRKLEEVQQLFCHTNPSYVETSFAARSDLLLSEELALFVEDEAE